MIDKTVASKKAESSLAPQQSHLSIKSWAEEDRPREKLLLRGKQNLSDAELLAILIGSGSRSESAVALCKRILNQANNDLNELGKQTVQALMKFKGIGEAKAISIVAALELGRRRQALPIKARPQITSSKTVFDILHPIMVDLPHEEFWVLLLNRSNKVMHKERISVGGVAGTVADLKIIFKKAIEHLASAIIMAHNHPSGNLRPSGADIKLTKQMVDSGKLLDIPVLDHLIIAETGYYSFADEDMM